jgi:hypothetical protein
MGLGVTFRTRSSGGTRTQRQDLRRKRTMMYSASLTIIVMVRGGWRRASEARRLQRQRQRVRARRETPESAYGCRKVDQNWEFKGCTHTQTQTNKHKQTNKQTHTHTHMGTASDCFQMRVGSCSREVYTRQKYAQLAHEKLPWIAM